MCEQTAQYRAERVAEGGDRASGDTHRPAALLRGKERGDQGKIIRHDQRATSSLKSAANN